MVTSPVGGLGFMVLEDYLDKHFIKGLEADKSLTWKRFQRLLKLFPLPAAIAVHSELRLPANP